MTRDDAALWLAMRFPGGLPPDWVDVAWWECFGPGLRARDLTGPAWIDKLACAWGIIRRDDSLTSLQAADQAYYTGRLLGQIFLTVGGSYEY